MRRGYAAVFVLALALAGCGGEDNEGSEEPEQRGREMHMSLDPEGERNWAVNRVVVNWDYPVDREAAHAVAVDDCVAQVNG